jgi:hypothetical protein
VRKCQSNNQAASKTVWLIYVLYYHPEDHFTPAPNTSTPEAMTPAPEDLALVMSTPGNLKWNWKTSLQDKIQGTLDNPAYPAARQLFTHTHVHADTQTHTHIHTHTQQLSRKLIISAMPG